MFSHFPAMSAILVRECCHCCKQVSSIGCSTCLVNFLPCQQSWFVNVATVANMFRQLACVAGFCHEYCRCGKQVLSICWKLASCFAGFRDCHWLIGPLFFSSAQNVGVDPPGEDPPTAELPGPSAASVSASSTYQARSTRSRQVRLLTPVSHKPLFVINSGG